MNPNKPRDLDRLRTAMTSSRRKLEPFRQRHKDAIDQYVGVYYSDSEGKRPVHVNLMELASNIYERQLASRPPRVNIFCKAAKYKPQAKKLEVVMNNHLATDHRVHSSLQRAIKSALFSMGIVKVGLKPNGIFNMGGFDIEDTVPYIEQILLDDWVHDMTARVIEEAAFSGHRYRVSLEEAKSNPDFRKNVRSQLRSHDFSNFNESGDERLHTITQGITNQDDHLEDMIELWEIWLPKDNLLVTLSSDEGQKPLRIVEWDGPKDGPFHLLFFNEVDGQTMPLAPAMLWSGLHNIVNGLYRKLDRQAQRVKHIGVTRGEDTDDAERIRMANDGEIVAVDNPDAVQAKSLGGIDQSNFAFMLQSKEMFSWLNGNLDALGGLGPQAETLGQDQLLHASANQRVSGMQDRVYLFVRKILKDYGHYVWDDPLRTYEASVPVQGQPDLRSPLTPKDRESNYYNNDITIEPFSMQYRSPSQRLNQLNQLMTGLLLPATPLMAQQGQQIDWAEYIRTYAKYADMPELLDIVKSAGLNPEHMVEQGSAQEDGGAPSTSHRVNERISRPGASPQGAQQTLVNTLMGGKNQPSEQAGMLRQMTGSR